MLMDAKGSANESGNATMVYKKDDIVNCDKAWQVSLGQNFVASGLAMEVKIDEPKETKKKAVKKKTTKKSK